MATLQRIRVSGTFRVCSRSTRPQPEASCDGSIPPCCCRGPRVKYTEEQAPSSLISFIHLHFRKYQIYRPGIYRRCLREGSPGCFQSYNLANRSIGLPNSNHGDRRRKAGSEGGINSILSIQFSMNDAVVDALNWRAIPCPVFCGIKVLKSEAAGYKVWTSAGVVFAVSSQNY